MRLWMTDGPALFGLYWLCAIGYSVYMVLGLQTLMPVSDKMPVWLYVLGMLDPVVVLVTCVYFLSLPPRSPKVLKAFNIVVPLGLTFSGPLLFYVPLGTLWTYLWLFGGLILISFMFIMVAVPRAYPATIDTCTSQTSIISRPQRKFVVQYRVRPVPGAADWGLPVYEKLAAYVWLSKQRKVDAVLLERLLKFCGYLLMVWDFISDVAVGTQLIKHGRILPGVVILVLSLSDAVSMNVQYEFRTLGGLTLRQNALVFLLALLELPIMALTLAYSSEGDPRMHIVSAVLTSSVVLVRGGIFAFVAIRHHWRRQKQRMADGVGGEGPASAELMTPRLCLSEPCDRDEGNDEQSNWSV